VRKVLLDSLRFLADLGAMKKLIGGRA